MNEDLEHQLKLAAAAIAASRYCIALVGAGISVESGIRPFRGKDGLWTEKGEPPMDGYQRFMLDPAQGWRDLLARRAANDEFSRTLAEAVPNESHFALAELERMGVLRHTISQNIDNLHFDAGSVAVTEIHGNRTKVRCVDCGARWRWTEFLELAPSAPEHAPVSDNSGVAEVGGVMMRVPPECPRCAGIIKSDTVMFGEPIPRAFLSECFAQAERADCIIVAGTSANVTPAADFAVMVLRQGGTMIEVNTDPTPFTGHCAAVLRGRSGDLLPKLVESVRQAAAGCQRNEQ
jgi:NAD-dependent protein deacetylase/lipoamidase